VLGLELLAKTFMGLDLAADDRVKIVVKPRRMEDGAIFKVERSSAKARLELTFHIWDGSARKCGVEVSPTATQKEIVDQARLKIDDEPLEEEQVYEILHNGTPAYQPWIQRSYELRPKAPASGLGVVRSKFGEMTVPLPVFQKARWLAIVRDSMPDPPLSVIETEPMKFQACYPEEEVLYHVRFVVGDEGEEHLIELLPFWENQVFKVRQAFGREMVLDESRPSKDNVLFVKSADGSPPDPTFERVLACTLGECADEFRVRVSKGQTTNEVKQAIKALHPGVNPSKILFEGSEMTEEDPVTEWATTTGTSLLRVQVTLDSPVQRFYVWQTGTRFDMGDLELIGRSRDEIWQTLRSRNPLLRLLPEYRLFNGQEEISWENLPVPNLTLVPTVIPVGHRGTEFKIVDRPRVNRPREYGPLTRMSYQVFTIENTPVGERMDIQAPNEITLAQLVAFFILPSGIQLDVGSVFYWNLLRVEDKSEKDKTKWQVEEIPQEIPVGFNLRVKCSSLREGSMKKMAHVRFGSAHMAFAMMSDDTVGRLQERVVDWMNQSGQGTDWTLERPEAEVIDFEWEYEVVSSVRDVPLRIFVKQHELEVLPSDSWMNVSDRLVKKWRLPKGSLLRIFPVSGNVEDQDDEDHSYTLAWEADKQYWFDVIYDPSRDRDSRSREVISVDESNRTDTFVVPRDANVFQVRDRWSSFLEVSHDVRMQMLTANEHEFHWSLESARDLIAFTLKASNIHGNANILEGSPTFVADQLSRKLGVKTPPLSLCQQSPRTGHGPKISFNGGAPQLSHRLLREHRLAWNLAGNILSAPEASAWWLPYNKEAIMRYGHSVNSSIPADPNEAEFPDEPWPDAVIIRVKSHAVPQPPAAPLPADGSNPPVAGSPAGWTGPDLGYAPLISAAASGLSGYTSVNKSRTVEGQTEEPPDEGLQQFRGVSQKDDLVRSIISWTTLESYPLRIGVSLPMLNPVMVDGEEVLHEAQLWEEMEEQWIITDNHAGFVYNWLAQRLAARSTTRTLPLGMPTSVDQMVVQTMKDGSFGYILFTPEDSLAEAMKKMDVQVIIEYDDGFMKVWMGNAYTIRMLFEEFRGLTHGSWEFGPTLPFRRNLDGAIVHGVTYEGTELQALIDADEQLVHPLRIVEERGRGTLIRNLTSQGKLLQYWART
jgi:hypothetical protein